MSRSSLGLGHGPGPDEGATESLDAEARSLLGRPGPARSYFLVCDDDTTFLHHLSGQGDLSIGRDPGADIVLKDRSVSRRHATVRIAGGEVHIEDRGKNGTRVNEQRVSAPHLLRSGDEVAIGASRLVLYHDLRSSRRALLRDEALFEQMLEQEADRAHAHHRPFSVLCILPGVKTLPDPTLRVMAASVPARHVPCLGRDGALLVLLPELVDEAARQQADALLQGLRAVLPAASAGLSCWPLDGDDWQALLAMARRAAQRARPGEVCEAQAACPPVCFTAADQSYELIIADPGMAIEFATIKRLARGEVPVLIQGESGTGKELMAAALHAYSPRQERQRPFLTINCGAVPDDLIESQLFGHVKGAFTGASENHKGLFRAADGGTLFLDEVAELSPRVQAALLRTDRGRILPVGATQEVAVEVRLVAATHKDLRREVQAGRFREDLFYRLAGKVIHLPPLRERRRELPLLLNRFVRDACDRAHLPQRRLSTFAMVRLLAYPFPGNVREARRMMEAAVAVASGTLIEPWHLPEEVSLLPRSVAATGRAQDLRGELGSLGTTDPPAGASRTLKQAVEDLERTLIQGALTEAGFNISQAARSLGVRRQWLSDRCREYDLGRPIPIHDEDENTG
jgi:DNA-binding NtrC family response regulator